MKRAVAPLLLLLAVACGPERGGREDDPDACLSVTCGEGATCVAGTCRCGAGVFELDGACFEAGLAAPRTVADVCRIFKATAPTPFTLATVKTGCAPLALTAAQLAETLARVNAHRWLTGLGPTGMDSELTRRAALCAVVTDSNPWGIQAHNPPPSATCWTADGAKGAGESNLHWNAGSPTRAVDGFMKDDGNLTTMGHRRWILNPPLGPIGAGHHEAATGQDATCLAVLESQLGGPRPAWYAYPPPGDVPLEVARMPWTFHAPGVSLAGAKVAITRGSELLAAEVEVLTNGFGDPAILLAHTWLPAAGESYAVRLTGTSLGVVEYEVRPGACP